MDGGVPKPTRDLAQAEQDLRDFGVCLLEGALPPEKLARVRDALYRAADDDRTRGREAKFGFDYAHDDTQPARLEPALARSGLRRPGRAPAALAPAEDVPGLADPALEHLGEHHRPGRRRDGPARRPDLHARAVVAAVQGMNVGWCVDRLRRRERRDADRARQPQAEPQAHRRGAARRDGRARGAGGHDGRDGGPASGTRPATTARATSGAARSSASTRCRSTARRRTGSCR